ncbi:MAG: toxic anion resistance protein, partial [Eubacterium sp.]|nr:toxic anion resistance protein [Eubacterium sp.]
MPVEAVKPAPVVQQPEVPEEVHLTPEEQEMVDRFAEQIDVTNTQAVMSYGAGTQKKMADFSERAIGNVRTKDMGEVGDMITSLVTELKNFDVEENTKG